MPRFDTHPQDSVFHLLKELKDDFTDLVRQEIALAKRDIAAKAKGLGTSALFFAVAAVIAVFSAFYLCLCFNNLVQTGLAGLGLSGRF